ncbi:putative reverse transcriptase domain-containing protein [Tanacetum coccineum]
MVGAGHAAYTDRFHELARLVPYLVTLESRMIERYVYGLAPQIRGMVATTEPKTIEKAMQIYSALTDEAVEMDQLRRKREYGYLPKCTTCNSYHAPGGPCRTCFNCNRPGHLAKDCRGHKDWKEIVQTKLLLIMGEGHGNQWNQARGRAFMLGAEEARQDPNIVTGTFTLNNHFATTLFDSGVDYSFVSTTFQPLLGIEPIELGFRYEIEIAIGQLIEIDKVIKGCKLEIEGHVFYINLIPFGHENFDVIIGMNWLSNYKAEIIFHEKVVRIPLPDGKVLRVLEERPEEMLRTLF